MELMVVGISHRTLDVTVRERAAVAQADIPRLLGAVRAGGIAEAAVLSTCNRTEIHMVCADADAALRVADDALISQTRIGADELAAGRRIRRGDEAARHLFRVAAGLDSLVVGESEIQGQVRDAWCAARAAGAAGPILNHLFRAALMAGKRVRSATAIGAGAVSVPAVAVKLALQADGPPRRHAVVVGSGRMARTVVAGLVGAGVAVTVVARDARAAARLAEGAAGARGCSAPMSRLGVVLADADILVSATSSPDALVDAPLVDAAMRRRPGRPLVVVDVAVPRDVAPAVGHVPGVRLAHIDDLARVAHANRAARRDAAREGERLITAAVDEFEIWRRGRAADPVIVALRRQAAELCRTRLTCPGGDAALDAFIGRVMHLPTVRLRALAVAGDPDGRLAALAARLGVDPVPAPRTSRRPVGV